MDNKNDWEEIEKWNIERMEKDKEKFGSYVGDFNHDTKGVDRLVKGLNITGGVFKVIKYIVIGIIIIVAFSFLGMAISDMNSHVTVDVDKTLENKYKVKVNTISKDVDDNENGDYRLELKKNKDIQFFATKKGNQLQEDLSDNSHRYYFNLWDSSNKNVFTIVEKYNSNFLEYHTYIEINDEEDIKSSMSIMNEFINTCENENFYLTWDIYLKKGEYRIYPYEQSGISNDEATQKAIETYNNYFK